MNLQEEAAHYQKVMEWIASNATSAAAKGGDACDLRDVLTDIHDIARDGLARRALV